MSPSDDDKKIRLFETHQKSEKSFWDYAKVFGIVAIGVTLAIALAL